MWTLHCDNSNVVTANEQEAIPSLSEPDASKLASLLRRSIAQAKQLTCQKQADSIRYACRSLFFYDLVSLHWESIGDEEALLRGNAIQGACKTRISSSQSRAFRGIGSADFKLGERRAEFPSDRCGPWRRRLVTAVASHQSARIDPPISVR